jgi:hypothetical protein
MSSEESEKRRLERRQQRAIKSKHIQRIANRNKDNAKNAGKGKKNG